VTHRANTLKLAAYNIRRTLHVLTATPSKSMFTFLRFYFVVRRHYCYVTQARYSLALDGMNIHDGAWVDVIANTILYCVRYPTMSS